MAKQDLVVKLLLDSGAFGTDLREAQRKAENFSNSIKNAGSTAGNLTKEIGLSTGALGKLGGMLTGAGAVVAAVGAFKSIMESSHDTAKIFQGTISGFTGVLSSLQTAIATFDFSNFNNGFLTVAKNAKIAKEAMMDAARSDVAYQFLSTQYRQQLKNYEVQSKDGITPELTAAVNTLLGNWETAATSNATQMFNAFIKNVKAKQSNLDFSIKDKDKVLQLMTDAAETMTGGSDKINADKKRWEQVKREMDNLLYTAKGGQLWEGGAGGDFDSMFQNNITATKEQREDAQRRYDELKAEYQDLMFKVEMYKMSSEDLKNQTDILNRAFQVQQEADDAKTQASGWNKSTPKKTTTTGGGGTATPPETGSIAYWRKLISEQTQLKDTLVVGTEKWWGAVNAIKAYTEELDKLLLMQHKLEHPMEKLPEIANIAPSRLTAPDMGLALPNGWKKEGGIFVKGEEEAIEKRTKDYEGLNDVLSSTVYLFDALGHSIEDTGDKSSQNAIDMMNIFSAIAEGALNVIPALQALTAAEGTAQAAKVPWPANIAAILSIVATVTSVFTSIKNISGKFAEGGIVGGTSYSGDKLFAMVNSGEMILNKRQQGNLANMLGGGGQVEFHISGDALVGVLNNKRNKTNLTR